MGPESTAKGSVDPLVLKVAGFSCVRFTRIHAMQDSDSREFVRLMTRDERKLYSYILTLVPNWNDADDILQETNVRLWEEFEKFEAGTNFLAWARRVAYYEVLTRRKRSKRSKLIFSEQLLDTLSKETEEIGPIVETRQRLLAKCVDQLAEHSRELLARCYCDGAQIKDVAKSLGRTATAVYQSLHRIRISLRNCIERQLSEEQTT